MNQALLHYAKQNTKALTIFSNNLKAEHQLIVYPSSLGPDIAQMYPEWANELPEKINFGSFPLKPKQVKQIIQDNEYLNFI